MCSDEVERTFTMAQKSKAASWRDVKRSSRLWLPCRGLGTVGLVYCSSMLPTGGRIWKGDKGQMMKCGFVVRVEAWK